MEFSPEKCYTLSSLSQKYLKASSTDILPSEIPKRFSSSASILQTIGNSSNNAFLTLKLMLFLGILPLTKQLSRLTGSLWSKSLQSKRADRNEYLLLHEFHARKYISPEKVQKFSEKDAPASTSSRKKAQYSGGLVLKPVKGLYSSLVLLLDFASLYPSIIKEYNICFSTVEHWNHESGELDEPNKDADSVLPDVISRLLSRRKNIKRLITKTKSSSEKYSLEIRQKAIKLVANSMYGCLGFDKSRFACQPIASYITSLGRKHLALVKEKVEAFEANPPVKVIYGDTDSLMVATGHTNYAKAKKLASNILKMINKPYRHMELELDGVYRNMVLLQKKKYAAKLITGEKNGEITTKLETKGVDLVRRDWCPLSKEIGGKILSEILSTKKSREEIVESILLLLSETKEKLEGDKIPKSKFVITKSLTKHPNSYTDAKIHPHVQVALQMIRSGHTVNSGDHIPYIVTKDKSEGATNSKKKPVAMRAVLAGRVLKSEFKAKNSEDKGEDDTQTGEKVKKEVFEVDKQWYLVHQIFPPTQRLCVPIREISAAAIAENLGIAKHKLINQQLSSAFDHDFDAQSSKFAQNASRFQRDVFRYRDLAENAESRLKLACESCGGDFDWHDIVTPSGKLALKCQKDNCKSESWLLAQDAGVAIAKNAIWLKARELVRTLYDSSASCDGIMCGESTRSVFAKNCSAVGCSGNVKFVYKTNNLLRQLSYFKSRFDVGEAVERYRRGDGAKAQNGFVLGADFPPDLEVRMEEMRDYVESILQENAHNFVDMEQLFEFVE